MINRFEFAEVGDIFAMGYYIDEDKINDYAMLIGDHNPLHIDEEYAKSTIYEGKISHGMLGASLFSTLLGKKGTIILSMDLKFKKPIRPNCNLIIMGEVTDKVKSLKIISFKLTLSNGEDILIEGKSKVKIL